MWGDSDGDDSRGETADRLRSALLDRLALQLYGIPLGGRVRQPSGMPSPKACLAYVLWRAGDTYEDPKGPWHPGIALSIEDIALALGVSARTVRRYLHLVQDCVTSDEGASEQLERFTRSNLVELYEYYELVHDWADEQGYKSVEETRYLLETSERVRAIGLIRTARLALFRLQDSGLDDAQCASVDEEALQPLAEAEFLLRHALPTSDRERKRASAIGALRSGAAWIRGAAAGVAWTGTAAAAWTGALAHAKDAAAGLDYVVRALD